MKPKPFKSNVDNPFNHMTESLFVPVEIQTVESSETLKPAKPLILVLNSKMQLQIPVETANSRLFSLLFKALGV